VRWSGFSVGGGPIGVPYKEGVGHVTFFFKVPRGPKGLIGTWEGPYVTRLALSNGIGEG
jgi:hypothetical protein